jgi:hypothetical protein
MNSKQLIRQLGGPVLGLVALVFLPMTTQAAVYSFNVGEPPSISADQSGNTIRLTGAGTFDTGNQTVLANGSYTIRDAAGKVIEKGTYGDAQFVSFEALGGANNGIQGGVLDITVTVFSNSGGVITGIPMEVVCPFENGVFDEDDDGTTIGPFTEAISGITVFHLIKP